MTPERLDRIRGVLQRRQPDLTVVADQVHKGRNIAAIMRTCDAVGVDTLHVVHPKDGYRSYRGTALGTQKWVNVMLHDEFRSALGPLKSKGFQCVVTSVADNAIPYTDVDFTQPTALVLGAECSGVSAQALEAADWKVTIPMVGMVESLNVSVASAIILQEAYRQRQLVGMYNHCRLLKADYDHRFFKWAHPAVAEFCERKGLSFPSVNAIDGEIIQPSVWYQKIRGECGLGNGPNSSAECYEWEQPESKSHSV